MRNLLNLRGSSQLNFGAPQHKEPAEEFPLWSTQPLPIAAGKVEYKFIVKRDDKKAPVRWEGVEGNRQLMVDAKDAEVYAVWGDPNERVVGNVEASLSATASHGASSIYPEEEGQPDSPGSLPLYVDLHETSSPDSLQPVRPYRGPASLDCLQLLKVPCDMKGQMVICGEGEELGSWNPYMAPALKHVGPSGDREVWALPGVLVDLTPGMAFKFVCLGHNGIPRWEENRPNRFWTGEEASYLFDLPSPRKGKEEGMNEELEVVWGNWLVDIDPLEFPGAIFHAFNWKFCDVQKKAAMVAALGFDAVQLSPAQRSIEGDQWWTRYQPVKYEEIHGLGSEQDLRNCCKACEKAGLLVFGDLVFNHMQVVASCEEWRKAQQDDGVMEILQRRLSQKLGPTFDRDDFQWPWYPLEGDDWDSDKRMEGWGCGEWSELKGGAPKVVAVHNAHMAKLKSCGISGFRFDAAKHMRPQHIADYVDKADVYAYGEVLSIDPTMQQEYTEGVHLTTGEQFPTTDFLLSVWMRKFIEVGPAAVDFDNTEWVKHLREIEMKRPSELPERAYNVENGQMSAPVLSRNSIRFARNHDTVSNEVPFYGLTGWTQASAQVAAAWLLATHDGSVLLLADDVKKSRMIKEALAYRKALRKFIESLTQEQRQTIRTEVRVREAEDGGRPLSICIACRVEAGGPDGKEIDGGALLGFCVLNPHPAGPVEFSGSNCLQQEGASDRTIATGDQKVVLHGDGTLQEPLRLAPYEGAFFLAGL
ncbi:unnamed protein product [Effrenium voratum]|nr:unnamed protein product [Effrenium voratum]